jgi:hypothetical protein
MQIIPLYLFSTFFQETKPYNGQNIVTKLSIDEVNKPEDKAWLEKQKTYTNQAISAMKVALPRWGIVTNKFVNLEYNFQTGNVYVVLENTNNSRGFSTKIKLDLMQWNTVETMRFQILDFIKSIEGKTDRPVEAILGLGNNQPLKDNFGSVYHMESLDREGNIFIIFKWSKGSKACSIDIRDYKLISGPEDSEAKNKPKVLITRCQWGVPQGQGVCLSGGAMDYFARFLMPKIKNGIFMWTNMHNNGQELWESCKLGFKPCQDIFELKNRDKKGFLP